MSFDDTSVYTIQWISISLWEVYSRRQLTSWARRVDLINWISFTVLDSAGNGEKEKCTPNSCAFMETGMLVKHDLCKLVHISDSLLEWKWKSAGVHFVPCSRLIVEISWKSGEPNEDLRTCSYCLLLPLSKTALNCKFHFWSPGQSPRFASSYWLMNLNSPWNFTILRLS